MRTIEENAERWAWPGGAWNIKQVKWWLKGDSPKVRLACLHLYLQSLGIIWYIFDSLRRCSTQSRTFNKGRSHFLLSVWTPNLIWSVILLVLATALKCWNQERIAPHFTGLFFCLYFLVPEVSWKPPQGLQNKQQINKLCKFPVPEI